MLLIFRIPQTQLRLVERRLTEYAGFLNDSGFQLRPLDLNETCSHVIPSSGYKPDLNYQGAPVTEMPASTLTVAGGPRRHELHDTPTRLRQLPSRVHSDRGGRSGGDPFLRPSNRRLFES